VVILPNFGRPFGPNIPGSADAGFPSCGDQSAVVLQCYLNGKAAGHDQLASPAETGGLCHATGRVVEGGHQYEDSLQQPAGLSGDLIRVSVA
jgi:hypothetical protein